MKNLQFPAQIRVGVCAAAGLLMLVETNSVKLQSAKRHDHDRHKGPSRHVTEDPSAVTVR